MFAWREVFWLHSSKLRNLLDEPVNQITLDESLQRDSDVISDVANAIVLPEGLVLFKVLKIPVSSMSLVGPLVDEEIIASSPFPMEDTASGYYLAPASQDLVEVIIAITSKADAMQAVHQSALGVDARNIEVWAKYGAANIVLSGFGESFRNGRYQQRLKSLAGWGAIAIIALVLTLCVPVGFFAHQVDNRQTMLDDAQRMAAVSLRARRELGEVNAQLSDLYVLANDTAKPLIALELLSAELDEGTWLNQFEYSDNAVVLDGYSIDAAKVLNQLSDSEHFTDVRPLSAIRAVGNQSVERFRVEVNMADTSVSDRAK